MAPRHQTEAGASRLNLGLLSPEFSCQGRFRQAIIDPMESRPVKYPLGSLSRIEAKTFGEPGHRTFHLAMEAGPHHCAVWLEKELLFQLGVQLQDAVQRIASVEGEHPSRLVESGWSGERLSLDFKVGQLSLEYDVDNNSFGLAAHEAEREESEASREEASSVSFWITKDQATALAEEALRICASGRPLCFLCGRPIDPQGHVCPRSNGHMVFEAG